MGKRVIAVPLDDDQVVFAEVDDSDLPVAEDPLAPIADVEELVERAAGSVRSAMDAVIIPTTQVIFGRLREAVHAPDEVELEFGLKLAGKLGAVFASTGAEGHIQVKLTWHRTPPQTAPPQSAPAQLEPQRPA